MMKNKLPVIAFLLSLALLSLSYSQEPSSSMQLTLDGPDMDSGYGLQKTIRLGTLSQRGSSALAGDFPAKRSRLLGGDDISDDDFKGVLYEFSPLTGGNNEFTHPNSSLALKVNSPVNWQLIVSARVNGDPSVVVDQLLFKQDEQREYTPFTPAPQVIARGSAGAYLLFFDLALRIDSDDKPGVYVVQINYDLVAY
ncbi:MAG: hypothetical protein NT166_05935 [Candidatus Aminicenantes bacterium]|nr:hypothetical protein [Candidatus Aminicenantes bacterium]